MNNLNQAIISHLVNCMDTKMDTPEGEVDSVVADIKRVEYFISHDNAINDTTGITRNYVSVIGDLIKAVPNIYQIANRPIKAVKGLILLSWETDHVDRVISLIRDYVFPVNNNYLYVKLDTGGFNNWITKVGCLGSEYYPVLRITIRVNDNAPLDVIINPGEVAINRIPRHTYSYHESTGFMSQVLASKTDLVKANALVIDYLRKYNVGATDPNSNRQTILVCSNEEFLKSFLKVNFKELLSLMSPRVLAVDKMVSFLTMVGNHELAIQPKYYTKNPIEYLEVLAKYVKLIQRMK